MHFSRRFKKEWRPRLTVVSSDLAVRHYRANWFELEQPRAAVQSVLWDFTERVDDGWRPR